MKLKVIKEVEGEPSNFIQAQLIPLNSTELKRSASEFKNIQLFSKT